MFDKFILINVYLFREISRCGRVTIWVMKFELEYFEELVEFGWEDIEAAATKDIILRCHEIRHEGIKAKKAIRKQAFKGDIVKIPFLIQQHAGSVVRMVDGITERNYGVIGREYTVVWSEYSVPDVDVVLVETLLDILKFLYVGYQSYFDFNQAVPKTELRRITPEVAAEVTMLRELFVEKKIDKGLVNEVLAQAETFVNYGGNISLSYRSLLYMRQLNEALLRALLTPDVEDMTACIRDLTVYMNYNTQRLLQFLTFGIGRELEDCGDGFDNQFNLLLQWKRVMQHAGVRPNTAVHYEKPSLRDAMLAWLDVEMEHLQAKMPLKPVDYVYKKLETDYSVDEWAAWVRLQKETGKLKGEPKELFDFFTTHYTFKSGRTENSATGFKRAYYNVEEGTANLVKATWARMNAALQAVLKGKEEKEKKRKRLGSGF